MTTATAQASSDLAAHAHAGSPSRAPPSRSFSTSGRPSRPSTSASTTTTGPFPNHNHYNNNSNLRHSQNYYSSSPSYAASSLVPRRSLSQNHSYSSTSRPASSSSSRPVQDILPQHDYETSRLATTHSSRSQNRDRPPSSSRAVDPTRPHRRSSSRSNHSGYHHQPDMPSAASPTAVSSSNAPPSSSHGRPTAAPDATNHASSGSGKQSRSRTTIPTQSGKWILGKTIGAGSMGKVKLARKEDGSEQVSSLAVDPYLFVSRGHRAFPNTPASFFFSRTGCLQNYPSRLYRRQSPKPSRQRTRRSVQGDSNRPRSSHSHPSQPPTYLRPA